MKLTSLFNDKFSTIFLIKKYSRLAKMCGVLAALMISQYASAVTGRHPTGVNVNSNGISTVLITFHNLETNEVPVDAFWCGDVTSTGVVVGTNPCVSGTLLGHLPKAFDLSRISDGIVPIPGTDSPTKSNKTSRLGPRNLTDVMSIPTPVIRRAYQQAQRGESSEFFYIRQFTNNGVNTYVTVTCRMAGGGARTPLALTKVNLDFEGDGYRKAITRIKQASELPKFSANITYTGSGLLRGRWEIVMPGDPEPTRFDLLSEASLPPTERLLQKRYRLLSRFQKFVAPNGQTVIKGPDPKLLPTLENGLYRILLRIEASSDKEGNSDTTIGILRTGGVAGFPMPTLQYFIGSEQALKESKKLPPISLLLPHSGQTFSEKPIKFSWFELQDSKEVAVYTIEFYQSSNDKKRLASALIKPGQSSFTPTQEMMEKLGSRFLWRVTAVGKTGNILSTSQVRKLSVTK
ncbi:MAG: hypothetical protein KUG78_15755 [Kangiellaceae bacterium]|nr:hypothetical protein [Kangiellaceae bacterium]